MSVAEGFFPDAIRCIDLFTAGVYGYCNLCMFRDEKEVTMNNLELQKTANEVRKGIIIGTHAAGAGHPGGSLSAADIFTYLYFEEMNIDPQNPKDPDRDRFVLSKGHTAPGLYSAMANRGYFPVEELETLRKVGARLQGHPSMQYLPGLDMSSGSLGQGISAACGMALGGKLDNKDFRVYTLLGDGEIEEGQVWEAAMFAAAKKLDNLVVIVDNNNLQIDGTIEEVNSPYPIDKKFEAFNFHVININGNDFDDLRKAFAEAKATKGVPTAIIAKTVKGKGVSFMENQVGWHGKAPNDEQFAIAMEDLAKIDKALEAQA
jgi:transketolase